MHYPQEARAIVEDRFGGGRAFLKKQKNLAVLLPAEIFGDLVFGD